MEIANQFCNYLSNIGLNFVKNICASQYTHHSYLNSLWFDDKFHIFHSIASNVNISTNNYPPLKRKPPLKSS